MNRVIAVLAVFAVGLALGYAGQESPKTETVFVTKWKTRVIENEAQMLPAPMPNQCRKVLDMLGMFTEPTDQLSATAAEIKGYLEQAGKAIFNDDLPKLNEITVQFRLASDDLGSAAIEVQEVRESINNQYLICQQALVDASQ